MGARDRFAHLPSLPPDWTERLDLLPAILEAHGVHLAYVFGSSASEDGEPNDIDLAYLPSVGGSFRPLYAAISTALGTDRLDLVDLRRANPGLLYEVLRTGRVIHRSDPEVENRFEASALARIREEPIRLRQAT